MEFKNTLANFSYISSYSIDFSNENIIHESNRHILISNKTIGFVFFTNSGDKTNERGRTCFLPFYVCLYVWRLRSNDFGRSRSNLLSTVNAFWHTYHNLVLDDILVNCIFSTILWYKLTVYFLQLYIINHPLTGIDYNIIIL